MMASMLALVAALSFLVSCSSAFNATSNSNVATYWGQGPYQERLVETCKNPNIDIINIGFVNVFPDQGPGGYPGTNFGDACSASVYKNNGVDTDLLSGCTYIGPDITTCQKTYGKKILLSLGGGYPTNQFVASNASAVSFAQFLWGAFGPQTTAWTKAGKPRPFGTAVVDGFDFDIESDLSTAPTYDGETVSNYKTRGYAKMIQTFRQTLFTKDTSKKYFISGAPQCVVPDAHFASLVTNVWFDFVFVQFYNTAACSARAGIKFLNGKTTTNGFTFPQWSEIKYYNPNAKVYIGLPANINASNSDEYYLTPTELNKIVRQYYGNAKFGGIMLWEATYGMKNIICGKNYPTWAKRILSAAVGKTTIDTTSNNCPNGETCGKCPTIPVSAHGNCGPNYGTTCSGSAFGQCCSADGTCSSSSSVCSITPCDSRYTNCTFAAKLQKRSKRDVLYSNTTISSSTFSSVISSSSSSSSSSIVSSSISSSSSSIVSSAISTSSSSLIVGLSVSSSSQSSIASSASSTISSSATGTASYSIGDLVASASSASSTSSSDIVSSSVTSTSASSIVSSSASSSSPGSVVSSSEVSTSSSSIVSTFASSSSVSSLSLASSQISSSTSSSSSPSQSGSAVVAADAANSATQGNKTTETITIYSTLYMTLTQSTTTEIITSLIPLTTETVVVDASSTSDSATNISTADAEAQEAVATATPTSSLTAHNVTLTKTITDYATRILTTCAPSVSDCSAHPADQTITTTITEVVDVYTTVLITATPVSAAASKTTDSSSTSATTVAADKSDDEATSSTSSTHNYQTDYYTTIVDVFYASSSLYNPHSDDDVRSTVTIQSTSTISQMVTIYATRSTSRSTMTVMSTLTVSPVAASQSAADPDQDTQVYSPSEQVKQAQEAEDRRIASEKAAKDSATKHSKKISHSSKSTSAVGSSTESTSATTTKTTAAGAAKATGQVEDLAASVSQSSNSTVTYHNPAVTMTSVADFKVEDIKSSGSKFDASMASVAVAVVVLIIDAFLL